MTRARLLAGTAWVIFCLCLLINPAGLWPLVPLAGVGMWIELANLHMAWQMRTLRQVLDGERR